MSDGLSITTNSSDVAALFSGAAAQIRPRANQLVRHWGVLLVAAVKAHAAGRPGPRMVTGDYNRSISLVVVTDGERYEAHAGTNRPQARRLEFGFRGVDSRGRRYDQPPYPHFGPAHDQIAPGFEAAAALLLGEVLKS